MADAVLSWRGLNDEMLEMVEALHPAPKRATVSSVKDPDQKTAAPVTTGLSASEEFHQIMARLDSGVTGSEREKLLQRLDDVYCRL